MSLLLYQGRCRLLVFKFGSRINEGRDPLIHGQQFFNGRAARACARESNPSGNMYRRRKAWKLSRTGNVADMRLVEETLPAVGPGEVRIKIKAVIAIIKLPCPNCDRTHIISRTSWLKAR